eukprot:PhF_6_TR39009/c0_g1_i1/m.58382
MGNLCSDPVEEKEKIMPATKTRIERLVLTTPAISSAIHLNTTATVRLTAVAKDKERTIELNWFDPIQKEQFEKSLDSIIVKRVTASNALSTSHWKTMDNFSVEAEFPGGDYYLAARSSSVMKDKNVEINVTLTIIPKALPPSSPKQK